MALMEKVLKFNSHYSINIIFEKKFLINPVEFLFVQSSL